MMNIIDRRLNPQGKSLANRQRFFRRAREQISKAVRDAAAKRGIQDLENGDSISIPGGGVREPTFHRSSKGGVRDHVVPGNKEFMEGDTLERPRSGGGGGGSEGSPDGDGDDEFRFVLSREEFLDIFLEDLELPDLVKRRVKQSTSHTLTRAGYSVSGSPANLNLVRTMRNSLSRRIALRRPKIAELEAIEAEIAELEDSRGDPDLLFDLRAERDRLVTKSKRIPFIDPVDVRYNRFDVVPKPVARAVMFCVMDVSGSMTEHMKDLAKRFFMLLYLFLNKRYRSLDVVFIRHTHEAKEVDEQAFFYSTETGGTVVSTAFVEMERIVKERYPIADWNIYVAQASDGDNMSSDNAKVVALLRDVILPVCQYFAYIEVASENNIGLTSLGRDTDLWRAYKNIDSAKLPLAMRKVRSRREIFPVFRELFARDAAKA